MTFNDLRRTLSEALSTGKIGTPVAIRMHVQLADSNVDPLMLLATAMQTVEQVFSARPARLMARENADGRQFNVLLNYAGGETVMLTVGRGSAKTASLNLLLIGNHGVIRLEGAELFEATAADFTADVDPWKSPIEQSLERNEAVALS